MKLVNTDITKRCLTYDKGLVINYRGEGGPAKSVSVEMAFC